MSDTYTEFLAARRAGDVHRANMLAAELRSEPNTSRYAHLSDAEVIDMYDAVVALGAEGSLKDELFEEIIRRAPDGAFVAFYNAAAA